MEENTEQRLDLTLFSEKIQESNISHWSLSELMYCLLPQVMPEDTLPI